MNAEINYLSIGHCCHDIKKEGYGLGGAASYSALVAKSLGKNPAVFTSVGTDFLFENKFRKLKIPFINIPAEYTTVFENVYTEKGRTQFLHQRAKTIGIEHCPNILRDTEIIHLGLIADDLNFSSMSLLSGGLIGASIQGCLREWDDNGLISPCEMDWSLLKSIDIVIISDEDIEGIESALEKILKYVDHVVLTLGEQGAKVFHKGKEQYFPAFPTSIVDTTGAGDVFSTAYLIEFQGSGDVSSASIFAHCAASIICKSEGLYHLPSLEDVQKKVESYKSLFKQH